MAERLRCLEPRGRPGGPEDGRARRLQRIGDTNRERSLGSDDDEVNAIGPGRLDDCGGLERIDAGQDADARLQPDRGAAGRDEDLAHGRLAGELPGKSMLSPPAADDEDSHQTATAGRWRIGRQARSIVWERSGPTDTSTIGTPASSSSAVTYRRACSGSPARDRISWSGSSQPAKRS